VNTAEDLDTDPVGAAEGVETIWVDESLVVDDLGDGVKVTPTNADPGMDENDALISEELLETAAELGEFDVVVVVVVVIVVERGVGVSVTPTNATPSEDEYEPLIALDELDESLDKVLLDAACDDELKAVIDDVVDVAVLVTVPGVGVRYVVCVKLITVLVVEVVKI